MEKQIEELESKVDQQEQYSMRNCTLFHGIPKSPNENTDKIVIQIITQHLDINVTEDGLDQSHRLGKRSTNQNKFRTIILKLAQYNIQRKIFYSKKKLKGKKISITESLTKIRMEALKKAQQEFEFCNAWLSDGSILYKDGSNKVTVFMIKI